MTTRKPSAGKREPCCVRALRGAAERLDQRAELLRQCANRKGWRQQHHFFHRAAELESMAMVLRGTATMAAESRTKKGGKRGK